MTNKVCAVIGVGPGNGTALARRFAREGYRVALLARTMETSDALAKTLDGARSFRCDVTDEAQVGRAFDALERTLRGRLRRRVATAAERFGPVTAGLIEQRMGRLRQRLAAVRDPEDDPPIHAARIRGKRLRYLLEPLERAVREGNKEGAAVLGFSSALAAYGGFFIPKSYGTSITLTGGPELALYCFIVFYLTCIAVTWWYYARRNAPMPC